MFKIVNYIRKLKQSLVDESVYLVLAKFVDLLVKQDFLPETKTVGMVSKIENIYCSFLSISES